MVSFASTVTVGIVLFAVTNLDDLFVLLALFAEARDRPWSVVAGQYIGLTVLYGLSVLAALLSVAVPAAYVGLLGLVPIAIGTAKLVRGDDEPSQAEEGSRRRPWTVASAVGITLANGGDNIASNTAVLATRPGLDTVVIGATFVVMTGLWCAAAWILAAQKMRFHTLRRLGAQSLPVLMIALGALILWRERSVTLLGWR